MLKSLLVSQSFVKFANKINKMSDVFLESLAKVGAVIPVLEDMAKSTFYKLEIKRMSDLEDVIRFITIYVSLKGDDEVRLSQRRIQTLAYYILYGYSKKTKDTIKKDLDIENSNLNNLNSQLRKMGYIVSEKYNTHNNSVNKELLNFVNYMVLNKGKYFLVKLV